MGLLASLGGLGRLVPMEPGEARRDALCPPPAPRPQQALYNSSTICLNKCLSKRWARGLCVSMENKSCSNL